MCYNVSIDNFINLACKHIKKDSEIELIKEAYYLAQEIHFGQKRRDGNEYFVHPYTVAFNIGLYGMDYKTIIAALLHDVYEDTKGDLEILRKFVKEKFGLEIDEIIYGVSKQSELDKKLKTYIYSKTLMAALTHNVRSIIIKVEDSLHNLRTIKFLYPHKQIENASENFHMYCNFAFKIGMNKAKSEMQDIDFEILYPDDYQRTVDSSYELYEKNIGIYSEVLEEIHSKLLLLGINHDIILRRKNFYGIYKKIVEHGGVENVHDFMAYKVIVDSNERCYEVARALNSLLGEKRKVSDYIKYPKTNGYKSYHSSFKYNGVLVQTQTKTPEMNIEADYGLASIQRLYPGIDIQKYFEGNYQIHHEIEKIRESIKDLQEFYKETEKVFDSSRIYVTDINMGVMCELYPNSTLGDFIDTFYSNAANINNARVKSDSSNNEIKEREYVLKNGDKIKVITSEICFDTLQARLTRKSK